MSDRARIEERTIIIKRSNQRCRSCYREERSGAHCSELAARRTHLIAEDSQQTFDPETVPFVLSGCFCREKTPEQRALKNEPNNRSKINERRVSLALFAACRVGSALLSFFLVVDTAAYKTRSPLSLHAREVLGKERGI